jgi:uncharacterized surface protein with fasciclin (FAS1) repeats
VEIQSFQMNKPAILLLSAFALIAGTFGASAQNPCNTPGEVVVAAGLAFSPANLVVDQGTTVVWVNNSGTHDVNGVSSTTGMPWNNPETFSTPVVTGAAGGVCMGTHTFDVPGLYNYDCSVGSHAAAGMVGTVLVLPVSNTVVDVIVNSPDHTILETAVLASGLNVPLSGPGPMTVFAPTDAAFDALPAGTLDAVLADNALLTAILTYHVAPLSALSTDLSDGMQVFTLNGATVTVTINGDGVFINDAQVTVADIVADNGVVHVIDAVLLPPTPATNTVVDIIVNSPDHNTLETAVVAAGLVETLSSEGPFTVFAPTDAAFSVIPAGVLQSILADTELLTSILTYHVVGANALSTDLSDGLEVATLNGANVLVTINGDGVFINDAQVIVADIVADNGVVHVIDAVLLPPAPEATTVVDIIVNSPDHTILETAVVAAGLVEALSGTGPFTVFAPTDAAFNALPAGTLEAVLADNALLTAILTYHVVSASALSTDLSDGMSITTLNGEDVVVTINGNGVFINGAQVIVADLLADNGVVHVIDAVLLPPTTVSDPSTSIALTVFPNPASHVVNVQGELLAGDRWIVMDAAGRRAFDGVAQSTLDVTEWKAGLYTLHLVRAGQTIATQRLSIVR